MFPCLGSTLLINTEKNLTVSLNLPKQSNKQKPQIHLCFFKHVKSPDSIWSIVFHLLHFFYFPVCRKSIGMMDFPVFQMFLMIRSADHPVRHTVLLWYLFSNCGGWETLALDVRLDPKVGEQQEEQHAIDPDEVDPDGDLVIAVLQKVILRDVNGHHDELSLRKIGGGG